MSVRDSLIRRIRREGAISVSDFMATALLDPVDGYYMRRSPLGRSGDFITAPEIHQMFGEMIAAWLIDYWNRADRPATFKLIELGPGRGTLMRDILRTADTVAPAFCAGADVWMVEVSPNLRTGQGDALPRARFAADLASVPEGYALVVANEFFDALPVHQYVPDETGWRERAVTWNARKARFTFVLAGRRAPLPAGFPAAGREGEIIEVSAAAHAMAADLARRAVNHGGATLIMDYGRDEHEPGGTLQAVREHRSVDPLSEPGRTDLSSRVDFRGLAETARADGAFVYGPCGQGEFLERLGIRARARKLTHLNPAERPRVEAALRRLTAPEEMGTRFRAMAIANPDGPVPAGFD